MQEKKLGYINSQVNKLKTIFLAQYQEKDTMWGL